MLKMPALIREWKAVSSICICRSGVGILLTVVTGWKKEVDQVAEIEYYMIGMGCHLLYEYVSKRHTNNEALFFSIRTHFGTSMERFQVWVFHRRM